MIIQVDNMVESIKWFPGNRIKMKTHQTALSWILGMNVTV